MDSTHTTSKYGEDELGKYVIRLDSYEYRLSWKEEHHTQFFCFNCGTILDIGDKIYYANQELGVINLLNKGSAAIYCRNCQRTKQTAEQL